MYEPTLTGKWSPFPQVKVTFDSLDPDTETVTVWRQADVLMPVPGTVGVFAAGGYTVDDLWAPRDIEVSYWAEMFDAAGASLGLTGSASVTVWGDRAVAVLSDPYDPANSVVVEMDSSFGEALSAKRDSQTHNVAGGTVSLLGARSLFQGMNLSLKTDTLEQAEPLANILDGSLVLIRLAPLVRPKFPTIVYAVVDYELVDADHLGGFQFGGSSAGWRVTGTQVSPITVGAAESAFPWQVYMDAFATWGDLAAAYVSWLDAKKNPPGA